MARWRTKNPDSGRFGTVFGIIGLWRSDLFDGGWGRAGKAEGGEAGPIKVVDVVDFNSLEEPGEK